MIFILDEKFIYNSYTKLDLMIKFLKNIYIYIYILKFNNLIILNNLYNFTIKNI